MTSTTAPSPSVPPTPAASPPVPPPPVPPPAVPAPSVWPSLRARDARGLIAFLTDVLGFSATAVYGEGDRVDHAQLDWPLGGGVMLGSVREGDDPWPQPPGCAAAYVVTDDVDGLHARAVAVGAEVLRAPADTDYGSREVSLRDPEGNLWSFGTYRGEPRADLRAEA